MLPIGITTLYNEKSDFCRLAFDYIRAIERAGGIPVPLSLRNVQFVPEFLKMIRGLILSGGNDLDPHFYGEEPLPGHGEISPVRDVLEIALSRAALQKNLPVLGICRGAQVLNVAAGGSIYQDISFKKGKLLEHMQKAPRWHPFHEIKIVNGTLLSKIFPGRENLRVNSFHHQVIKDLGSALRISATTSDGVIEALESTAHPFALGVQWHPEALAAANLPGGQEIFDTFCRAASLYQPG